MSKRFYPPLLVALLVLITGLACGLKASAPTPTEVPTQAPTPKPTATDTPEPPTPTPTPTPTPEPSDRWFFEDFEGPVEADWNLESTDDVTREITDGELHVVVDVDQTNFWASADLYYIGDVTIDLDARQVEGPDDNNYGVLIRYQDSKNFYEFDVSGDGQAGVFKVENGDVEALAEWQPSDSVNAGNASNHITVVTQGGTMDFYVNGDRVASVTDSSFEGGGIALLAGTYNEVGVHIAFDNVAISGGEEAEPPPEVVPLAEPLVECPVMRTGWNTLFADDFSPGDPGWGTESNKDVTREMADGVLQITVKDTQTNAWTSAGQSFQGDIAVDVDAEQIAGPNNNNYGLLVRYQDSDNFYEFDVSGDGFFTVRKVVDGEAEALVEWTESAMILPGAVANHLTVVVEEADMTFCANGYLLITVTDDTFTGGDIGLVAGSFDEAGVAVSYDNVEVRGPAGAISGELPAPPTEEAAAPTTAVTSPRADIPVMPDAQDLIDGEVEAGYGILYLTKSSVRAAGEFYEAEMPDYGWKADPSNQVADDISILLFTKGDESAVVMASPDEEAPGFNSVLILIAETEGPAQASPTPAPSPPTPTPAPAANPYAPPAGKASLVIFNDSDLEINFTVANQENKLAPRTEKVLYLDPGHHTYSFNTFGFEGINGEGDVAAGRIYGWLFDGSSYTVTWIDITE